MNEVKRFLAIGVILGIAMVVVIAIAQIANWNTFVGGLLLVLITTLAIWAATIKEAE